ncbi:serine/threonine protein kinase [Micromonospora sp. NPDC048898]|uniref:serine/threonine protein kinase n=1 Tax=Micromonospora sp. NPDC048898 TaxID=3364260 RepID=UPI0037245E21
MSTPLRPHDPREVGPYELLGRLGAGGMGTVYLGRARNGRLVAIKVIQTALTDDPDYRARFRSEVNRARQVPPFCTAEVLDADVDCDQPYLVVEYVDGPTLTEVVQDNGPLSAGALQGVALGVATALAAIHSAGVIHRDLKPQNVLFALGNPKVIDFGIARAYEATSQHTRTGEMVGTVAYMAPERLDAQGREMSYPADIFSWAVVVAYAATGHTPFDAGSPTGTAMRILTQPPDLDGIPMALREIVARALSKEPEERPTARELVDLLVSSGSTPPSDGGHAQRTRAMTSTPVPADRSGGAGIRVGRPRLPGTSRRIRTAVSLVVLVALGAVGLYVGSTALNGRDGPTRAGDARTAAVGGATPAGPRTIIQDSLSPPQVWKNYASKTLKCAFDADAKLFIVGTDKNTSQRCPGPAVAVPADQVISLEVGMQSADSCASIWWLDAGTESYQLVLCPDSFSVQRNFGPDSGSQPLAGAQLKTPITVGTANRVVITIKDYTAVVNVNGALIGRAVLSDRSRTSGKISLGINGRGDGKAAGGFGVMFGNVTVATPS